MVECVCWCGDRFPNNETWESHSKTEHSWMHDPVSYDIGTSESPHTARSARPDIVVQQLKERWLRDHNR